MSIRWHFMSNRPSSNTANRPTGPAPTIRTSVLMTVLMRVRPRQLRTQACPNTRMATMRPRGRHVSALPLRNRHDQPIQFVPDLYLAGQPRIRPDFIGKVEHVLFHRLRFAHGIGPRLVDIDMACRACAGAAAFGFDAGNGVADGVLHHSRAVFRLDVKTRAVERNVGKLGHQKSRELASRDNDSAARVNCPQETPPRGAFPAIRVLQLSADGSDEV